MKPFVYYYLITLGMILGVIPSADAAIFYSNQTGDWNTATTWTNVAIPAAGDTVIIQNGHVVTISGSSYTHTGNLTVEVGGELIADCGDSSNGLIFDGGAFHVLGTLTLPFPDKDLRIRGSSLFWAHDGSVVFISDDLIFQDNTTNVLENVCIEVDDDLIIVGTSTTICGSGGASMGTDTGANNVSFQSSASSAQICAGTGVFRGPGGSCTTTVVAGTGDSEPNAYDDASTTTQDVATTIDVLDLGTADDDADGDQVQLFYATGILTSGPTANGGTVTINDNGTPGNYADDFIDYTPPPGFTGDDTFIYTITDGMGAFSSATVTVTVTAALPVTLTQFSAVEKDCQVLLTWTTANELDNQGFELEKSLDGQSWKRIAQLSGAGTTNQATYYSYTDSHIQRNNYYRLRQVDYDGTATLSKVILVEANCLADINTQKGILSVMPNPIRFAPVRVQYETPEPITEYATITDLGGRILQRTLLDFESGVNTIRFDLSHLPSGTFFLNIGQSQYKLVKIYD